MAEPHESRVYSDLAVIYDSIFGRMFVDSEHSVLDSLKLRPNQRVLEVGVGTGISLHGYPPYVHVVGIIEQFEHRVDGVRGARPKDLAIADPYQIQVIEGRRRHRQT